MQTSGGEKGMVATAQKPVWNETLPFVPKDVGVDSRVEESVRKWGWTVTIDTLLTLRDIHDDWDGNGATAPSRETVDSALHLAIHFRDLGMREPNGVVPGVNGTVIFDWQGTDQSYLEVEVTEPFHAECVFISPGKPTKHWVFAHRDLGIAA
jgi:hypothetical protein